MSSALDAITLDDIGIHNKVSIDWETPAIFNVRN